ncbi:MAG TPA: TonB-dependent receptor [Candidatus Eisenbacteria bacterium]
MRALVLPAWVLLCIGILLCPRSARSGGFTGTVRDAATLAPVEGAVVVAYPDSGSATIPARSGADGRFFIAPPSGSSFMLHAWRIGYERKRIGPIRHPGSVSVEIVFDLAPTALRLNPVVVTASRRRERALDAPASITVVTSRSIRERPALTPVDYLRALPGVDVASKGMTQTSVVARGFSSAQSSALLTLTDHRSAGLPSLRYNAYNFIPIPAEDIERIEVVRGPGAALYGPNCDRGVLQILTRSPFESPGTAVSVLSGEREAAQGSFRRAGRVTEKLGVVLSALYFRGRDWKFIDPIESMRRDDAIAAGADPGALKIGRRDPLIERAGGEARGEWRMDPRTSVVLSGGINRALRNVDLTPVGAVQVRNWDSGYLQVRASRERCFGQVYVNASDAGDSYFLRTGLPIVDRSRFWAGQFQNGASLGPKQGFTYGIDAQRTVPRTGGTIHGRNEGGDEVTEIGSFLHSQTRLSPQIDLIAAIRADHHSRFDSPVFSPRAGFVYKPADNQTLRVTFNRAYRTPGSDDLFADFVADSLSPLPYGVRVEGVPRSGYTFERGCGGPCMRSPFTPIDAGGPGAYLALDATQEWDAVAAILKSQFAGIDTVPAPTAGDVGTVLATLNSTGGFDPPAPISDIPALRPTITNTVEAGYQGLIAGRVRFAIDGYRSWIHDFIGHLRAITPSVFMDRGTLESYLISQNVDAASAAAIAAAASAIPVGTVTPREALDPADLIFAVRNFGNTSLWGTDASLVAELGREWWLGATHSWVSRDLFPGPAGGGEIALNAPPRKGSISLGYRASEGGISGTLDARFTGGFPVMSGVYSGRVNSYTLVDCRLVYRVSEMGNSQISVAASNLFDVRHQEFLGSPAIGRLLLVQVRADF